MAPSGPADLLAAWERGLTAEPSGRALELHRAALPAAGSAQLRAAPLTTRAADLYALRRALFGDQMEILADCVHCGSALELGVNASALAPDPPPVGPLHVNADDWEVEFRLPSAADLAEAAAAADARRELAVRCTVAAYRGGEPADPAEMPDGVVRRLAEAAERVDPGPDVTLRVACPDCGATTVAELDIAAYLWAELDNWARELLLDVHLLARVYGWTEPEILALSPLRRRYYLELCADE